MRNMDGKLVLILRFLVCFKANSLDILSFSVFLCKWNSRDIANHWIKRDWPERILHTPGHRNIFKRALSISPYQTLMKQYVRALDKQVACFLYIADKFPKLSGEKVKEGIFVGPQIRQLIIDEQFQLTMTNVEKNAWLSFREVVF